MFNWCHSGIAGDSSVLSFGWIPSCLWQQQLLSWGTAGAGGFTVHRGGNFRDLRKLRREEVKLRHGEPDGEC